MQNTKFYRIFIVLSFIVLPLSSCDLSEQPQSNEIPTIIYTVSGGFWGGLHTKLVVNSAGEATLESTYPPLILQLSDDEHADLLSCFNGFEYLPENFNNPCFDGYIYAIEQKQPDYSKQVIIDGCTLETDSSAMVTKIKTIVIALNTLATKIYDTQVPWKGLIADFTIDSDFYNVGDPITLQYRISNPTSEERTIYFRHQNQFWFALDKLNFPSFHYSYPNLGNSDSSTQSEIHFAAGETKEIVHVWDQQINSQNGDTALGVGYYNLHMNLYAGDLPTKSIWFEIIDKSIPISGVIIEDINGESNNSSTYKFMLSIRNWTTESVTLNFPSSERINVEVYDSDKPTPGPLIYSSPSVTDSLPSVITLFPGEIRTFIHEANKSDFVPWYLWTYVRIRLLSTNLKFICDGQLRIFPYQ